MAAMNLRRNRDNRHIRELTREVRLHVEQFIQPLFVVEGLRKREAVPGLGDVYRDTAETLLRQVEADLAQGIPLEFGAVQAVGPDLRVLARVNGRDRF